MIYKRLSKGNERRSMRRFVAHHSQTSTETKPRQMINQTQFPRSKEASLKTVNIVLRWFSPGKPGRSQLTGTLMLAAELMELAC